MQRTLPISEAHRVGSGIRRCAAANVIHMLHSKIKNDKEQNNKKTTPPSPTRAPAEPKTNASPRLRLRGGIP